MQNFAFIILNYKAHEKTKECIQAIQKRTQDVPWQQKRIVVFDNCYQNDDCANMVKEFNNSAILFFSSKENLGFARGNNLAYKKLLQTGFCADFVVFINSDCYIVSGDFCKQVSQEYEKSNFAILGPRIINQNNKISAFPISIPSKKELYKKMRWYQYINKAAIIPFDLGIKTLLFLKGKKQRLEGLYNRFVTKKTKPVVDTNQKKQDVRLEGCCLVFSKMYLSRYTEPFDSRTFLYYEEDLLFLRAKRQNLATIYEPDIIVFHELGGSSVNGKSEAKKQKFIAKYYIESIKILLQELQDTQDTQTVHNV